MMMMMNSKRLLCNLTYTSTGVQCKEQLTSWNANMNKTKQIATEVLQFTHESLKMTRSAQDRLC